MLTGQLEGMDEILEAAADSGAENIRMLSEDPETYSYFSVAYYYALQNYPDGRISFVSGEARAA